MFNKILIANRGEIACRIMRTAQRLGIRCVAVYSEADANALHVALADEAFCIGAAPSIDSYLRGERILAIAQQTGAQAIHPGYGFLSENAEFAAACAQAGICFIGPPPAAIRAMGSKSAAKKIMAQAGVPLVPGYHEDAQDEATLLAASEKIGYPVLLKAVAGGGGKGMRRVDKASDFEAALESAQREAASAFGDPRVLVEKYILSPRHIEIQVFADAHGNVVHLFERDCSLQRRHQKVIEEAPAPGMTPEMREAMGKAAVEAARAVGYVGAGTVEFIADGREGLRPDRFFFMEMNTRLQVEHPVTEAITGLDLVELQFRAASGETLPFTQADLAIDGHAVEARLYAEDPEHDFLPSTGKLWALEFPEGKGIRIDTGVRPGDAVTPFYDPMIAKIIAHGATRDEALERLAEALGETVVAGPRTNVAFLKKLCEADAFRAGRFDTGFIDRNIESLGAVAQPVDSEAVRLGVLSLIERDFDDRDDLALSRSGPIPSPWDDREGFQLSGSRLQAFPISVEGQRVDVSIAWPGSQEARTDLTVSFGGDTSHMHQDFTPMDRRAFVQTDHGVIVLNGGRQTRIALFDPFDVDLEHLDGGNSVKAPMHGKLIAVFVKPGERVHKGQRLAIVEAMKMEHALLAPADGEVAEVAAEAGAQVAEGARLIVLKTEAEDAADGPVSAPPVP
jgi:3-methylcrotonyl-CoA carboxylase alpha subunit